MPELANDERIAALEAENARLLAALVEARVHLVCQEIPGAHATQMPLHIVDQALDGDDSALKAMLDAARHEGRMDQVADDAMAWQRAEQTEQERDSLRAQLADDSPGIIKALFEFAEAECGHCPASARHALTTVMETIAALRAQLAEAQSRETALSKAVVNCAETIDKLAARVERLRAVADDVVQGGGIADLEDARAALAETPSASLEAVREQARREALESLPHYPGCGRLPCSLCFALAAQPAKEPQP